MTARTWRVSPRPTVGAWCWHGGREAAHVTAWRETCRDPVTREAAAAVITYGPEAADRLAWAARQYPGTVAARQADQAARMAPAIALALAWARL